MGYTDFETDNAFYRLHLINHSGGQQVPENEVSADFDGFVQELMGVGYGILAVEGINKYSVRSAVDDKTSNAIREIALSKKTPIFFPDVCPQSSIDGTMIGVGQIVGGIILSVASAKAFQHLMNEEHINGVSRRRFIAEMSALAATLGFGFFNQANAIPLMLPGEVKARRLFGGYDNFFQKLFHSMSIEGRNVVNAMKIEGFIAPLLRERLGRKPKIHVSYGAGHFGLEECLKDAEYRKEAMMAFSPPEEYFCPENLRDCFELTFPNPKESWKTKVTQHKDIITFPQMTEKELSEVRAKVMEFEARINRKQIRREPTPMDRKGFLRMLAGRS